MTTVKRNWLKNQIELGKMECKCNFHYTDDYAFDNAYDFGKTDWLPARISNPKFEQRTLQNGSVIDICADDDRLDGYMNMRGFEFTGKSGGAYKREDGTYTLRVHSNLNYSLRMK